MKLKLLFVTIALFVGFGSYGQATLPHFDPINFTVGQGLQTQTGWTSLNSGDDLLITSGNLSYIGLVASTGNKVTFDGAGIDAAKLFTQQTTGTVYYSFLMNLTALGSLNTTGGYFTVLNEGTSTNYGSTVWLRADGAGYDIGINPRTTVANTVWSAGTTAINATILVVVSYQIVSGPTNDAVKLWINPTLGGTEPTATLTATNGGTDLANINRILLRQDSATATPFIEMDELRVGTTWASVTPAASTDEVNYANVQFPGNGTINVGGAFNVYAQTYEPGVTEAVGVGTGIVSWIGYNSSNTDPSTASWTWVPATFNAQQGNNDEFVANIGTALPAGTYYYASRFQLNGGPYKYGGFNGGFWNGTTNVNGTLTVNPHFVDWANLQSPSTATITQGSTFAAYGQVYEPGVTNSSASQGTGITVDFGISPIGSNTNPNTWTNWTSTTAIYNNSCGTGTCGDLDTNGIPDNDEYSATTGSALTAGTYYYTFRYRLNGGSYMYGGYNAGGGGFWNGTTDVSGVLTVTIPTITTTPTTLTGFTYVNGSGPSSNQTYTISGANLSADILLTAPTDYEISTTSGSGFGISITLTQTSGTVSTTTIYVRLKAGLAVASYNSENIAATSIGATTKNVTCSGNVTIPSYTITFNGNGSTGGSTATQTIASGANVALTTNGFTKTGYTFDGWNTAADGSGTSYANGANYTMGTANVTLYAHWVVYTGPCLTEDFVNGTKPTGWIDSSTGITYSSNYADIQVGSGYVTMISLANPSALIFDLSRTTNATAKNLNIEVSTTSQSSGFSVVASYDHSTTTSGGTTSCIVDLSAYSSYSTVYIKFNKTTGSTSPWRIDNINIFCASVCTPTVTTPTATAITTTTATLGGNITSIGCSTVTTRGIEWSTTSGFANGAGTIVSASGSFTTGVFTQDVAGLPSGAVIFYKAFATNTEGTAYSGQASFTTLGSEINIKGVTGSNPSIADGDTTPQGTNNTLFTTIDIGSSQEKIFRIENLGTEVLNITSISMLGGTASGDFVISGITLPTTIAGGASLDFSVIFSPSAGGIRNTTLTIANDDYDENPYDIVIQGTGNVVASVDINVTGSGQSIPDNSIYPFPLNHTAFGLATVGVTTVTRTFTIENLGSSILSLTGSPLVSITGPHATLFTVTVLPSATIAAGSSSTFQVTFNPTSLGTKNATIEIVNNDSDENPYNFNISGTAKGNKNIYVYGNGNDVTSGATTTSLTNLTNFGSIALTTGIKQNTFVISNLADADRYFSNVSISGTDASMFTVVAQTPVNALSSGNSTSFTINFTPTSVGTKNALITFSSYTNSTKTTQDSSDPSTYTFAISGDGIVYTVCNIGPVQTIAQQDFEDTPATPTLGYNYTTDGLILIAGGTFNNGSGSKNAFIGAKSFQFTGIGTSNIKTTVVNFNAIDISNYVNINLSFKTGAFRTGTFQGLDINEFIQVESSIDGGVSWSTEGVLRAYNNSRWDFAATGVFNAYYTGNNNGATIDSRNGNAELANGYATYNVKNLPRSSNLLLRLTLVVDRNDEIWAIDNIKLEGQLPLSTTWDGSAWSPGVPNSSTKAIFDGDYTTDLTLPIPIPSVKTCECLINATKTVTISSGDYLEVQSDLTVNGILNFDDASSLVQVNDNAVNTGIITYNRTTPDVFRTDYTYWASPVAGYTLGGVSQNLTLWDKYYSYDSIIEDWKQESPSTTMFAGAGYIIRAPETPFQNAFDAFFIGVPNNGAYSVNGVIDDRSYLLGNPYPSALDADTFLNDNAGVLDGTLYFWTHITPLGIGVSNPGTGLYAYSRDDYAAYNPVGGVGVDDVPFSPGGDPAPSGGVKPSGKIASGQGFFASSKTTITGADIVFNNSMRVGVIDISKEINSQFFKTRSPKTKLATIEKHRIWLDLTNSQGAFKQTLIGYITDATNEYDSRFDGESYDANEFVDFYSVNQDKNLVIQGRALPFDENDLVSLGFRTTIEGAFTINIDELDGALTNQAIFIEDKLTNTVFDLKTGNYTFNTVAGTFNDRFVLRYTDRTLGTANFETLENQVLVSNKNRQIKVNSKAETIDKVMVYDLLGRQLFKKEKVNSNELTIANVVSSQQTLLVKVSLQNGQTVTKKIIY
jgi:uncharacterized repeat protein (TIGR02543 family)